MTELIANTTEAATEKHLPVVTVEGNTVTVSSWKCRASYVRRTLYTMDLSRNRKRVTD